MAKLTATTAQQLSQGVLTDAQRFTKEVQECAKVGGFHFGPPIKLPQDVVPCAEKVKHLPSYLREITNA